MVAFRIQRRIPAIIRNYVDAVRAQDWKGAGHPEDWDEIDNRVKETKTKLLDWLDHQVDLRK